MQRLDVQQNSEPSFMLKGAEWSPPATTIELRDEQLPAGSCLKKVGAKKFMLYRYKRKAGKPYGYRYAVITADTGVNGKHTSCIGSGSYGSVYKSVATIKFTEDGRLVAKLKGEIIGNKFVVNDQACHVVKRFKGVNCLNAMIAAFYEFDIMANLFELTGAKGVTTYSVRINKSAPGLTKHRESYIISAYKPGVTLRTFIDMIMRNVEMIGILFATRNLFIQLALIHSQGIAHLDLNPTNIKIDPLFNAHLLDFGLARRIHDITADEGGGTPGYIAPEALVTTHKMSAKSDMYSAGKILNEMFGIMWLLFPTFSNNRLPYECKILIRDLINHLVTDINHIDDRLSAVEAISKTDEIIKVYAELRPDKVSSLRLLSGPGLFSTSTQTQTPSSVPPTLATDPSIASAAMSPAMRAQQS